MSMAFDQDYRRHRDTWLGFTRLLKWALAAIVLILVGMALALL